MRVALPIALMAIFAGGCAPQASFQPESIPVGTSSLNVKGWTVKDDFHVELRLQSKDKSVGLHSLYLVQPDGTKHRPAKCSDRTPQPPKISVGFGVGIPISGGGSSSCHGGSEGSGSGLVVGPGISVPLTGAKDKKVTAVDARWEITEATTPVTDCSLEVNLVSIRPDTIELTTVLLAMAHHEDEETNDDKQPDDDKKTTKKLVREIDFTQKGLAKTKTLDT